MSTQDTDGHAAVYFNSYIVPTTEDLQTQSRSRTKNHHKSKDIDASLNSIYASVHNQLNNKRMTSKIKDEVNTTMQPRGVSQVVISKIPLSTKPAPPPPITTPKVMKKTAEKSTKSPQQPAATKTALCTTKSPPEKSVKTAQNQKISRRKPVVNVVGNKSNPKITVEFKHDQRMRLTRSVTSPKAMDDLGTYKQRSMEVIRQKRILEEMLTEHEKLQTNRKTMVAEIAQMKNYLKDISKRLEASLQKLGANRTVVDMEKIRSSTIPVSNRRSIHQRKLSLDKRLVK